MIIVEKQEGAKTIPYEIMQGTNGLLILDNQLYLNLPTYERDFPVHLDVSKNEYGMLTMGLSRAYVAQIDIPAREYKEVDTGEVNEEGDPIIEKVAQPFDLKKVTLTLWEVK